MTRNQYINHLDKMYAAVMEVIKLQADTQKTYGTFHTGGLEDERAKKTEKMLLDLAQRYYEDGAVSRRIREEHLERGEAEQDELDLGGK